MTYRSRGSRSKRTGRVSFFGTGRPSRHPSGTPRPLAVLREVFEAGLDRFHRIQLSAEELTLERIAQHTAVEIAVTGGDNTRPYDVLFRVGDEVVSFLTPGAGQNAIAVVLAGHDADALVKLGEQLRSALADKPKRAETVPVWFWSADSGGRGGSGSLRSLDLPELREVIDNYSPPVAASLKRLGSLRPASLPPGRLMLWHGAPGTGKTWALRALGREWRDWCDVSYVTDPERLLSGDGSYMLDLLLSRDGLGWISDLAEGETARWALLVLEDAGELLAADAPARLGLGFSRLLNAVDGLIGQGTRSLVLVTTNEPLGKLHPAVTRAGRRLAEVEFTPLAPEDARRWLATRGVEKPVNNATALADLFATASDLDRGPSQPAIGFE